MFHKVKMGEYVKIQKVIFILKKMHIKSFSDNSETYNDIQERSMSFILYIFCELYTLCTFFEMNFKKRQVLL